MPGARTLVIAGAMAAWSLALGARAVENCLDGIDDDGDGRIDCNDTDCFHGPDCPREADCANGLDDDLDRRVDCQDLDCTWAAPCRDVENCVNGPDDDGDRTYDCRDADCVLDPGCTGFETCDNGGVDDDDDGLADCAEPSCWRAPGCREESCWNRIDDDRDGMVDCMDIQCCIDLSCGGSPTCGQPDPEACDDAIDNDGDGLVDCADSACLSDPACAAFDHDGDGVVNSTDCAPRDPATWAAPEEIPRNATVTRVHGGVRIAWSSLASQSGPATVYDVLSGRLDDLRVDGSILRASCLAAGLSDTSHVDEGTESGGRYYLVRGRNSCTDGATGYGRGSDEAPPRSPAEDCR